MQKLTTDQIEEIGRLYREGWGARSIADQLDKPEDTIINVLRGKQKIHRDVLGGRLMQGKRPGNQLKIYSKDNCHDQG